MMTPLSLLLVEDDLVDAALLERELYRGGFDLTTGRVDTEAAMHHALDERAWDIVIADYHLPAFSGAGALQILKARNLDIPLIIVSGVIDEETAVASLKAGAQDFVLKGNLARLVPAVERELREVEIRRQHRGAREALRDSEEKYRVITDHASDAILITEEDGTIQYANPVTEDIFGYSVSQLIGQPVDTLVHERGQIHHTLRRYIADDIAVPHPTGQDRIEFRARHKTGRGLRLEASISTAVQHGRRMGICILRDVTERRRADAQRERSYHAAQRAGRLAAEARKEAEQANQAKSNFLAVMSHELRTPVTAVIGYAALLMDEIEGPLNNSQKTQLERVIASSNHLAKLIEDILSFAMIEAGNVQYTIADVSVYDLFLMAQDIAAPLVREKGVNVMVDPVDDALIVRADRNRLRQVLLNLLDNAAKFASSGDLISLSCDATEDSVEIRVRDTGCGIPAEKLDVIFHAFAQVDSGLTRRNGGVGLGLAISKEFVNGMGGHLGVSSTNGVGSAFTITLPRGVSREASMAWAPTATHSALEW